jgi:hypothetical protein
MKKESSFPTLLECFFTQRLMAQRQVSPSHTINTPRHLSIAAVAPATCRNAFGAGTRRFGPGLMTHSSIQSEKGGATARPQSAADSHRSFFRYAAFEDPCQSGLINVFWPCPVNATRKLVSFLTRPEIDALLAARPQYVGWPGNHTFLLVAVRRLRHRR